MKSNKNLKNDAIQILIVEDSPTQAEQLKYILEKNNYNVVTAQNGKIALELILKHSPALVISDIVMPLMNGYELCKEIKSNDTTSDIPVILLTLLSNSEGVLEGLACGADNFLTKPYNQEYLISLIEQILANKELKKVERVRVGVEISFSGKKRFITANQQQMLSLLISSYDAAVQKNKELIQTQEELKAINDHLEELVENRTAELLAEVEVRKSAEERIIKLNRVYAVLSNINQTIVRVHETNALFNDACHIAVDKGKFQSAWIGIVDNVTNKIESIATAGLENDLAYVSPDHNPIFEAIQSGNHFISNNINTERNIAEIWKQASLSLGFSSFAVFPLVVFKKVVGGFAIYSKEVDSFDEIEISLLDETATDISFAIEYIQKESKRKEAEIALIKSEEYTKRIIESSKDCIKVLDLEGNLLSMSEGGQRLLEIDSIESYLNKPWTDSWKGDDRIAVLSAISNAKNGATDIITGFCPTAKGKPKWWEIIISPIKDEQGEIIRILAVSRDITERKQVENELVLAKEKAEESDRLKSAFLHNISHEVRTPMNAIIGFSEFLTIPDLTQEKRNSFINTIVSSCHQLLSVISDIISISTIEANQITVIEIETNLNPLLNQLHEQFLEKAQKQGIALILKNLLPDDEVRIITDDIKLAQILSKLIDNALKFTKQGYVNFGYKVKGADLEFFVEDTGIGIHQDMFDKIFVRFSQVESTLTRKFGGSGLGLSISKAYIELLGGKIWLRSELGKGTTFYFTIPYKKANTKTSNSIQSKTELEEFEKGIKTILIAEDEESNFLLLEEVLSGLNLSIIWAKNGEEAIDICKNKDIDLVLMDVKMPIMNGFEATMRIKDFKPNLPIIAQTAYSTDFDKRKAFASGCNDYISKPIKKDILISKIKGFLLTSAPFNK